MSALGPLGQQNAKAAVDSDDRGGNRTEDITRIAPPDSPVNARSADRLCECIAVHLLSVCAELRQVRRFRRRYGQ